MNVNDIVETTLTIVFTTGVSNTVIKQGTMGKIVSVRENGLGQAVYAVDFGNRSNHPLSLLEHELVIVKGEM